MKSRNRGLLVFLAVATFLVASNATPAAGLAYDTGSGGIEEINTGEPTLKGEVSFTSGNAGVGPWLDELLAVASARDSQTKTLESAVKHYASPVQKVFKGTKDAVNYMLCNRGFLPSTEVGTVLLDEDKSFKSRNLAELARQKQTDELHLQLVSTVMQLAMGLGMTDRARGAEITGRALVALNDLVGAAETNKTAQALKDWGKNLSVPDAVFNQKVWDIKEQQVKSRTVTSLALSRDPVAREVTKDIHKYSRHGKAARAGASVIETSLNLASLTPTMIGPAAQAALLAFFMTTGGTEEDKIIREVYLDKRLQSRAEIINQEANLATNAYQTALLTHNPLMLGCSESIVRRMAGREAVDKTFGTSVIKP